MRLMSLNIWAGREFDALMNYISECRGDIDVFCFQEVFHSPTNVEKVDGGYRGNIFSEIQRVLSNHNGSFAPAQDGWEEKGLGEREISYGLAAFFRNDLNVESIGDFFIRGHRNSKKDKFTIPRNLQYAVVERDGINYTIAHFHGLWDGGGKGDTSERIEQSRMVRQFADGKKKLILCGDFNLLPDTESLKILEEGMINLIRNYGIETTRSRLYTKPDRFADYALVSPDVCVQRFEVPYVEASDHLPLVLEFS